MNHCSLSASSHVDVTIPETMHLFPPISLERPLLIFWAFVITIITYIFEPSAYVRFGVLHLLALASIVAFPVARKPEFALGMGLILLIIPLSSNQQLDFPENSFKAILG